ncbi:hypothetical protein [Fulvivirga sediminis]|uniref:Uncharacterized protein n=1 Tax=Fulvivirga sediminis TaxID=2803949 RepID=A0A937F817_9BACT|nr:hypothetical protein [Fulvivirga sediminis]MBL3656010.1 hypothetical protein [Fulvivirga sediminis]
MRILLFLSFLIMACQPDQSKISFANDYNTSPRELLPEPDLQDRLNNDMILRDSSIKDLQISIWVTTTAEQSPQEVENENWPPQIITTYNIYKDKNNAIVLISEYPFSESGDWFSVNNMYFNAYGFLYAQNIKTITFNSSCDSSAITTHLTTLYNNENTPLTSEFTIMNDNGDTLKTNCDDLYEMEYKTHTNVRSYLQDKGFIE